MGAWTHNICASCWARQKDDRPPEAVKEQGLPDVCCWCGARNAAGIYQRADPAQVPCEGVHLEEIDGL